MTISESTTPPPKALLWTGRVLSAIPILMMFFGAIFFGLFKMDMVRKGMIEHGYPPDRTVYILITEATCALLYMIPQTAVLGAILITAYLGGATATHVRVGEDFAPPVVFGVITWLGLLLRDRRLWALLPFRKLPPSLPVSNPNASQSVDPIE